MELLKFVRRRSFLSESVYTALNIFFAVALVLVMQSTESILLGMLLVLVSKWRILAVRPRFWFVNLRSNIVDIIVSLSFVLHLFAINAASMEEGTRLIVTGAATLGYIAWLLFVKPRSKRVFIAVQAGVAIASGTAALFAFSFNWPVSLVVILMALIGFSAARHVLSSYDDETHETFLSLAWGLVFAQIGWVAYHWVVAYSMPFVTTLLVPQVAIIVSLVSFVAYKAYDSFYHHSKIRTSDIILPLLFSLSIVAVLLFVFNRVGTAI